MAKDPAFLFYTGDFHTGTQFFTDGQVGKYIRLLMAQHQHGHLNEKQVLNICKTYDDDVMAKFKKDKNGLWYNERLENEVVRRKEYSISRSKNRKSGNNICKTYDKHMETETKAKDIVNSINVLTTNVFSFLERRGTNTMEVKDMVRTWVQDGHTDILPQLKAMKIHYESNDLVFPTKIGTLTTSFASADWIQKLKDSDPEKKAERTLKAQKDANKRNPEPDTIGVSAPGSLG